MSKDENLNINTKREQKEFIKDDKSLKDIFTFMQQRGNTQDSKNEKTIHKEKVKEKDFYQENYIEESDKDTHKYDNYMQELNKIRQTQNQENLKHDMLHNALGVMSGIQEANIDYDELNKMAKSNIRDYDELVFESLSNDGYISRIENNIKEFIKSNNPDINELAKCKKEFSAKEIAQAYVNVVKEIPLNHKNILKLTQIDEIFDFEKECYENAFDKIRNEDKMIDKILDKLDMEMGRER